MLRFGARDLCLVERYKLALKFVFVVVNEGTLQS